MNPKQIVPLGNNRAGNTLVVALLMLAVLSLVGANVLFTVSSRYNYTQKAVGWTEALTAAESGADYGFANCRWSLGNGGQSAWIGWKKYDPSTSGWIPVTGFADADIEFRSGNRIIYDLPTGSHLVSTGEGVTDLWYHVEVDAPLSFVISTNRWYRIRATGYAGLTGLARANNDSPDGAKTHNDMLRKFDLISDHFIKRYGDYAHAVGATVAVVSPQAARRIEIVAQPKTPFPMAIVAMAPTGTPVSVPLVDSYNSTDTLNYPGGLYSSIPRNPSTGIGVNAPVYVNAPISSFNAQLYGSLETNGGTVKKTNNITGTVTNNVSITVPPVTAPPWKVTASSAAPATLTAGTTSSPLYRSYTKITNLTVLPPPGQTQGVANLYITGDVTQGITVAPGVTLKIWFEGNFEMKASDINNQNNNAAFLQLYGIDPPSEQTRSFEVDPGAPGFHYFTLDAPGYDFTNNGNPDIVGAFVVKTIIGNGNTTWHYDEALAGVGLVTDYQRASWVEDPR